MALIWFGIFLCVGVAIAQLPAEVGLRDALALAQTAARLETMDTSPDLTKPYTLWSGLIGGMFLAMAYFGCDQSQVQRYLSGRSLTESRLSLLFNAFLKVPMQFLILLTGVLVFVFFHFHEPPLLWNRGRAVAARGQRLPAGELERLRAAAQAAHAERRTRGRGLRRRAPRGPRPGAGARGLPSRRSSGSKRSEAEVRRLAGGPAAGRSTTSTTSSRATWSRSCAAASPGS